MDSSKNLTHLVETSRLASLLKKQASGEMLSSAESKELRSLAKRWAYDKDSKSWASRLDDGASAYKTDRQYQRKLMAARAEAGRTVEYPAPKSWRRRKKALDDPEYFCRTYFPDVFYQPFGADQLQIVQAIADRVRRGGYQAIATPRGGGKSTITKIVGGVWAVLAGHVGYLLLLGATGGFAQGMLRDIREWYEKSDLLAEDFPEVCVPIRALEGAAQRAKMQLAVPAGSGLDPERSRMVWGTSEIILPTTRLNRRGYPISPSAGAIVAIRGVDSSIRGLVVASRRPDLVIADDLETRESVESDLQIEQRIRIIERDVLGLQGPDRQMPTVLLGTIMRKGCLIDQFADRSKRPAWHGLRLNRVVEWPENGDLWEQYIELRQDGQREGDPTGRAAHAFYLEHRAEMDKGVVVGNPYRFRSTTLPDGTQAEVSAIESVYNDIADMGRAAFDCEYQNEPHPDEFETSNELSVQTVQHRFCGAPRGQVPDDVACVTAGIDIGARAIHWVVGAWRPGLNGQIIDYGAEPVNSPMGDLRDESLAKAIEQAITAALLEWRDRDLSEGWKRANGTAVQADCVALDAGYMEGAVYAVCRSDTTGRYRAIKGYGSSNRTKFPSAGNVKGRIIGREWWGSYQRPYGLWLWNLDADKWKLRVHSGFLLPEQQEGAIVLFGNEGREHRTYAHQIVAEVWTDEYKPKERHYFKRVARHNHFLDATAYAMVAADMTFANKQLAEARARQSVASAQRPEKDDYWAGMPTIDLD